MEQPKIAKVEEVVEFCNKLGYPIDKTTLDKCESDTIVELYSSLLEKLQIIKKENLKIDFKRMSYFEYSGLHDRPIYILKLFLYMDKFMREVCKISDFTTNDLFNPNPKKTKNILGRIVKFFKFRKSEKELFNSINQTLTESINSKNDSMKKLEEIRNEYDKALKEREEERPQVEQLLEEIKKLEESNKDITQKTLLSKEELIQLIQKKKEIDNNIILIDDLHVNYTNCISNLKNQIVSSPEKMQTVLEQTQNSIDLLTKEISDNEKIYKKLELVSSNYDMLQNLLNEYNSSLVELNKIYQESSEIEKQILIKKDVIASKTKKLEDNKYKLENVISKISSLNNYLKENSAKNKEDQENKEKELQEYQNKYNQENAKLSKLTKEYNLIQDNIIEIQNNLNELLQIKKDYESQIEKQMEEMYQGVKIYSAQFSQLLEHFSPQ